LGTALADIPGYWGYGTAHQGSTVAQQLLVSPGNMSESSQKGPVATQGEERRKEITELKEQLSAVTKIITTLTDSVKAITTQRTEPSRIYYNEPHPYQRRYRPRIPQEILRNMECYNCREKGHTQWMCKKEKQGNVGVTRREDK
jgi:hypothetical protein